MFSQTTRTGNMARARIKIPGGEGGREGGRGKREERGGRGREGKEKIEEKKAWYES